MKPGIHKFQIAFLLVLYAVTFVFFHLFPEHTNASHQARETTAPAAIGTSAHAE